jgi:hypothetical protein
MQSNDTKKLIVMEHATYNNKGSHTIKQKTKENNKQLQKQNKE